MTDAGYTTPWFWDTPEGGGWARYWRGSYVTTPPDDDHFARWHPDLVAHKAEILADHPGRREPTSSERRAWRVLNPRAAGDLDESQEKQHD